MRKAQAAEENDLRDILENNRFHITSLGEMLWVPHIKDQSGNISAKINPSILFFHDCIEQ